MTDQVHKTIVQICHHIQKDNPDSMLNGMEGGRLLTELDYNLGNHFLIASTTPADDNDEDEPQDRSRSPSPPRVFAGEIVK